ncbi:hypothetical protein GCM10009814_21530 [Lapillicoccus jejuensis]
MRVLVVDDVGRVLLFRDSDLGLDPVPHWWITPGGGVDAGERDEQAAVREVAEETGFVVTEDELVGPLASRTVVHGFSDVVTHQDELFWVVRVPAGEIDTAGHTDEERLTMTSHRWWTRAELDAVDPDPLPTDGREPLWPSEIPRLLDLADAWRPGAPAARLDDVEESSVPVDAA